jgi:hypothetical protein
VNPGAPKNTDPSLGGNPRIPRSNSQGPGYTPRTGGTDTSLNSNQRGSGNTGYITPLTLPPTNPGGISDPRYRVNFGVDRIDGRYEYRDRYRRGYCHYDPYWRDSYFGYGYWWSDPWRDRCYISPYYWYISLPGYISWSRCFYATPRVIIIIGDDLSWRYCGRGNYGSYYYGGYGYNYNDRGYSYLDRSVSDLVDAFLLERPEHLADLLPRKGTVNIYIEGEYAYTLNNDDFYDMTADMIRSTQTTDFQIEKVKRSRSGEYIVLARHEFVDPNNMSQTVWMTFTLDEEYGRYVIVETGTSRYRPRL